METIISILGLALPIAVSVLMICSWWILYDKMGEKGWACLIPFYGRYLLFKRVWEGKIYFISLVLSSIAVLFDVYMAVHVVTSLMEVSEAANIAGGAGLVIFTVIFSFISFVVEMMLNWRMTKCFGHGIGYFLGIMLMPVIFVPILAFGSSYYDYY